jgi:hypothetical protein
LDFCAAKVFISGDKPPVVTMEFLKQAADYQASGEVAEWLKATVC